MRTFKIIALITVLTSSIYFIYSCKKDKEEETTTEEITTVVLGKIAGTVYSQKETTIAGANVFVDDAGTLYLTQSDSVGDFELEAPVGQQTLNIQTGDGEIFRSATTVDIEANTTKTMTKEETKLEQASKLAYITGEFDKIETIIVDSLGYEADELQRSDLNNLTTLQTYSAIFLNCGIGGDEALDSTKYANLEQFVLGGGSL